MAPSVQFHVLSFEGPDGYARAGGIASRITGLVDAFAENGFDTHFWFVGDPELPGEESDGTLHLHRWCQWISRYHPGGVYDGEEGKRADYSASLPPHLVEHVLGPHLRAGGTAVVLAEEWHTTDAVLHLDGLLHSAGLRDRVRILWNANNVFGFHRVAWERLRDAATITTVSRFMKHLMWSHGVDPLVVPNGLPADAFLPPDRGAVEILRRRFRHRTLLGKVARFDPDKRWLLAMRSVARLKAEERHPLLVARGGIEAHGADVLHEAAALGLRVIERELGVAGPEGLVLALSDIDGADVVHLRTPLDRAASRTLFRAADVMLANSGREPFGLVGLETMAVGGIACTGMTGEDYVVPGENALVLQTDDPGEFAELFGALRSDPERARRLRRAGTQTARRFSWSQVLENHLLPRLRLAVR